MTQVTPSFKPEQVAIDADGFVQTWNMFGILPDNITPILELTLNETTGPIVEMGSGNGLLSAGLADACREVTAVDKIRPIAIGGYTFKKLDLHSEEFFDLLSPDTVLVARRTLCLFWSLEWTDRLNRTGISTMVIESLRDEKHVFKNATVEHKYLLRNGWEKSERRGDHLILARR